MLLAAAAAVTVSTPVAAQERMRTILPADASTARMLQTFEANKEYAGEVSVALPVQFEFGKWSLTAQGAMTLSSMAAALNDPALIPYSFVVEGHTDAVGSNAANLALSKRRAETARDYLVSTGVSWGRLVVAGYGEERLIPGVSGSDGRNRRVEIVRLP